MEKEMAIRKQESRTLPANEHKIASQASIGQLLTAYRHPELSGFSFPQQQPVQRQISIGNKKSETPPMVVMKGDKNYIFILNSLGNTDEVMVFLDGMIKDKCNHIYPTLDIAVSAISKKIKALQKTPAPASFTEEEIQLLQRMVLKDESDGNLVPLLLSSPECFYLNSKDLSMIFKGNQEVWVQQNLLKLSKENFYSYKAIRDHLISLVFRAFPKVLGEETRPKNYYKPKYDDGTDSALHHDVPWNVLKPLKSSSTTSEDSDIALSKICWKPENLAAGPQYHRIMDSGAMRDIEAKNVIKASGRRIKADIEGIEIAAESPKAHMRTDTLQFIFAKCLRLREDIAKADAESSCTKKGIYNMLTLFLPHIFKAIRRFETIETEFDFSIPSLIYLRQIVLERCQKLDQNTPGIDLKNIIQEVCAAFGSFVDDISSMAPSPFSKIPVVEDELDPVLLLPRSVIRTFQECTGLMNVYNPPTTGNNCFLGALLGPDRAGVDLDALRQRWADMIGQEGILRPGAMVTTEDITAIFANPDIRAELGINGVLVYIMANGNIHPVPMVLGDPNSSSPVLVCLSFTHYIRLF